jgi:hypothetical protein
VRRLIDNGRYTDISDFPSLYRKDKDAKRAARSNGTLKQIGHKYEFPTVK